MQTCRLAIQFMLMMLLSKDSVVTRTLDAAIGAILTTYQPNHSSSAVTQDQAFLTLLRPARLFRIDVQPLKSIHSLLATPHRRFQFQDGIVFWQLALIRLLPQAVHLVSNLIQPQQEINFQPCSGWSLNLMMHQYINSL